MPMVRIDIPAATSEHDAQALARAVHQALVDTFNVPADDCFQTITRHTPQAMVCTPEYLGIRHTHHVAMVQITCSFGRSLEQKRALFARIASEAERLAHFAAADVLVHLVETARENWSFGNGLAQYAP